MVRGDMVHGDVVRRYMCPPEATAWFLVSAVLREEVQTRSFFEDKTF